MKRNQENPFANPEIAARYEGWYQTAGRQSDQQEKALLHWLLAGFPKARTVLEVGCGTGHFTRWFRTQSLQAVGLDMSSTMLNEAFKLGNLVYIQGEAQTLPFLLKTFDLVILITSLEFLPDPRKALAEALRVARQGLILGVLNADSRLGRQYKREGGPVWEKARFFTLDELKQMVIEVSAGQAQIRWRTTLWPFSPGSLPLPWGGFIGMAVDIR